jgi:hypothetical protein
VNHEGERSSCPGFSNSEVALDHVEVGVTEHALEGEDVAAIAQVLDGEGVA